jgi:hypothetical protein
MQSLATNAPRFRGDFGRFFLAWRLKPSFQEARWSDPRIQNRKFTKRDNAMKLSRAYINLTVLDLIPLVLGSFVAGRLCKIALVLLTQ